MERDGRSGGAIRCERIIGAHAGDQPVSNPAKIQKIRLGYEIDDFVKGHSGIIDLIAVAVGGIDRSVSKRRDASDNGGVDQRMTLREVQTIKSCGIRGIIFIDQNPIVPMAELDVEGVFV